MIVTFILICMRGNYYEFLHRTSVIANRRSCTPAVKQSALAYGIALGKNKIALAITKYTRICTVENYESKNCTT
jgi:hypothetical protein